MSYGLDPGQPLRFVDSDLDPNCSQLLADGICRQEVNGWTQRRQSIISSLLGATFVVANILNPDQALIWIQTF